MHASLKIGDSILMLNDEFPEFGGQLGPSATTGSPVALHVYLDDVDTAFQRAVSAGASVKMPLMDQFWGDRYGVVIDPFGHRWSLATHTRDMSPEEMEREQEKAFSQDAEVGLVRQQDSQVSQVVAGRSGHNRVA